MQDRLFEYSQQELEMFVEIIQNGIELLSDWSCGQVDCNECQYDKLCNDLRELIEIANHVATCNKP